MLVVALVDIVVVNGDVAIVVCLFVCLFVCFVFVFVFGRDSKVFFPVFFKTRFTSSQHSEHLIFFLKKALP